MSGGQGAVGGEDGGALGVDGVGGAVLVRVLRGSADLLAAGDVVRRRHPGVGREGTRPPGGQDTAVAHVEDPEGAAGALAVLVQFHARRRGDIRGAPYLLVGGKLCHDELFGLVLVGGRVLHVEGVFAGDQGSVGLPAVDFVVTRVEGALRQLSGAGDLAGLPAVDGCELQARVTVLLDDVTLADVELVALGRGLAQLRSVTSIDGDGAGGLLLAQAVRLRRGTGEHRDRLDAVVPGRRGHAIGRHLEPLAHRAGLHVPELQCGRLRVVREVKDADRAVNRLPGVSATESVLALGVLDEQQGGRVSRSRRRRVPWASHRPGRPSCRTSAWRWSHHRRRNRSLQPGRAKGRGPRPSLCTCSYPRKSSASDLEMHTAA